MAKAKAFLEKLPLAFKDSGGRRVVGNLNIEVAYVQGHGNRGQGGDTWEKDRADTRTCGDQTEGSKGGGFFWEIETRCNGHSEVMRVGDFFRARG